MFNSCIWYIIKVLNSIGYDNFKSNIEGEVVTPSYKEFSGKTVINGEVIVYYDEVFM